MYEADGGALMDDDVTVNDVRSFAESHDVAETVRPAYAAQKACNRLTEANGPTALIITTDGEPTGEIQGILTRFDVPEITRALTVRLRNG